MTEILREVRVLEFLCIALEHLCAVDVPCHEQEGGIAAKPQSPEGRAEGFCALPGPVRKLFEGYLCASWGSSARKMAKKSHLEIATNVLNLSQLNL